MYLPHAFWVAIKFLHLFMVWWNAWGLRNTEWNFGYFMLQLGSPVVLYLQASALPKVRKGSPRQPQRFP